jgi:thioesterase superfamily protein
MPGEHTGARRALADTVRRVVPLTVLTTVDDDALARATALVAAAAAILAGAARASRYEGNQGLAAGSDANDAIWETHAMFGTSHPFAPPLVVSEHPPRLDGTVTFGPGYEGGPGAVYGGYVAAAFDAAIGRAVLAAGHLAVTRSLLVRFRRPTPLGVPLRLEAVVEGLSGRNVEATGRLWSDDALLCDAEAVFTKVDAGRFTL